MIDEKQILQQLAEQRSLTQEQVRGLFHRFMVQDKEQAQPSDAQIGAILFALGQRLPTAEELTGGANALRDHMLPFVLPPEDVSAPLLDTCGTGGSGMNSFNTSTLVAFVAAAAGCRVVKHGNRSLRSLCGSADLLEALAIPLDLTPDKSARLLAETNFCFCFAPLYHPATKRVQLIRRELGIRTIFNFLGPLANPARVPYQVLGVSSLELLPAMADTLLALGLRRAFVVCGLDGLDEITLTAPTKIYEIKDGQKFFLEVHAQNFGLPQYNAAELLGGDKAQNLKVTQSILNGDPSPHFDLVLANASAALVATGKAQDFLDGVAVAGDLLRSGKVRKTVEHIQSTARELISV